MNPIKLFLITLFLGVVVIANGQHPFVTFFGGANAASMSIKLGTSNPEIEDSYGMLYGLNVGALYNYVFKKDKSQELAIESGLLFDSRGYGQKVENDGLNLENKTTLYYLDVPVYLNYFYRFRSRNKVYFGAGPYVGVGLFGNSYVEFQYAGVDPGSDSQTVEWGDGGDLNRLDYGVTAKAGFLWDSGFNISASYDYGLPNVSAVETQEYKNRLIRISLGYSLKFE